MASEWDGVVTIRIGFGVVVFNEVVAKVVLFEVAPSGFQGNVSDITRYVRCRIRWREVTVRNQIRVPWPSRWRIDQADWKAQRK